MATGKAAWDYFADHGPITPAPSRGAYKGPAQPQWYQQHFYDTTRTVDVAGNIDGEDQQIWERYGW